MRLKNKIKLILLMSFVLLGLSSAKCFATSISVSASKRTVSPGESFSVTISGSDATGKVYISAKNGSVSQSSAWIENSSVTVTVKAGSSGTVTVSASGELSSDSGVDKSVSGSTSVSIQSSGNNGGNSGNQGGSSTGNNSGNSGGSSSTGNQGGTTTAAKDGNANLSNLGIRPNDFSGFSSGKLNYSVNVPNDVTSINVYAKASSSKASVSGTGNKNLKVGTNKFSVVVTAENGTKKTYTISVNRAGEDGEIVPNVVDEEPTENEEPSVGVGLESLVIEGYELDKEFKTEEHEYIVKVNDELTLEDLEAIKAKISAVTNSDRVVTEMIAEISEDGKKTITIIVKDDEKEYSRYVITFEKEEEKQESAVVLMTDDSNSGNSSKGIFGLDPEQKIYVVLGCLGLTLLMAIYFACSAYVKSKRLAEYEEDEFSEESENSEFEKMNQYYVGFEGNQNEDMQRKQDIENLEKDEFSDDTVEEVTSKLGKLGGYRSMRNKSKSIGRHF